MLFNLVCFLHQVSPPEEIGYHFHDPFELALLDELSQPWPGDNYVIVLGGDHAAAGAKCLLENPLDAIADNCAAYFS